MNGFRMWLGLRLIGLAQWLGNRVFDLQEIGLKLYNSGKRIQDK